MTPPTCVLVPLKGDTTDEEAVALACDTARQHKAALYAIHVIEVKRTLPVDVDLPDEASKGEVILGRAERAVQRLSYRVQTEILQARDVGTAIVDEAVARQVDLIIMGISYRRKFGEFDVGRTAQYVLQTAPCRVWLTRAAPAAAPSREHGEFVARTT